MKHQKYLLSASATLLAMALGAAGAPFTPGDVVIYRVGDGSSALSSAATAVFIDEYSPAGALVQSIPMPVTALGAERALVASGSATSEGLLSLSVDGRYLMLTGYDAAPGTASVAGTHASSVNRVVGRIGADGSIDTSTALGDFADGNNARSATSTNGVDIWVAGAGSGDSGGVRYATLGGTTSTQLSTTVTNLRQVAIFDSQLYVSTSSGSSIRVATVGSGLPTAAGQAIENLPGFSTDTGPYAFFMADLSPSIAGLDTLYVADDGAEAITKYIFDGTSWSANGTVGVGSDDYRGVAGSVDGGVVHLYAVRGGAELVSITDSGGYAGALSGSATLLASASGNTAFRGVALVPVVPEPGTIGLLSLGLPGLLARRRRV